MGLQNYAIIISTDNSHIKFNNNKINSLQTYDTAQNYRIVHKAVQRSVCPNTTSKCQTTTIFKISIKENNNSNETCRHVHDLSMYRTSYV
jgi:hypothetical protein